MCNKNKYNKKEAQTVLNETFRNRNKKWRREKRYYQCPHPECNGAYHLTSIEEYAEIQTLSLEDLIYKKDWLKLMSS